VGWLLSPYLTSVILGPDVPDLYFRLFFLIFFSNRLQMMPLLVLRVQEKSLAFALVNVAKLVLQLSLNIYFVVVRGMAVEGVLWGNLIAAALVGVGLQIAFLREIHVRPSWQKFVEILRYGAPLSIFFLGNFVLVFSDRYFLNFLVGAGAVGIYSLAYRFVSVLSSFAFAPFQLIWGPKRFEVAKSPDRDSVFPRVFLYLNLVVGGTCLLISVFVDEVLRVMADPEFFSAHELVPVLLLAQVAFQWVSFSNLGLLLRDRTSTLAKISGVAVVVVVGLNYLLIPHWGAMGAAWATLGAYIFRYLAVLRYSQKADSIGHDWPRVLRVYAVVVIAVVFESSLPALSLLWSLAASSAVVVLAAIAIAHFVLGTEEKEKIMSSVRSLSKGKSPF
jgi:O-antigen/teichoic acid export membrane protein